MNKRRTQEDLKKIEQDIDRQTISALVDLTILTLADKIGVYIREKDMPRVVIDEKRKTSSYDPKTNTISIKPTQFYQDGGFGVIAEEAAHFIRERLRPKLFRGLRGYYGGFRGDYVHEFFGYLGRRIIGGSHNIGKPPSRNKVLEALKKIREAKGRADEWYNSRSYKDKLLEEMAEIAYLSALTGLEERRRSLLVHARPYNAAANLDLGRIDPKELFRMPDEEVRRMFFRGDPIYEENAGERQYEKPRGLESKVVMISIIFFTLSILTLSVNITGGVINLNPWQRNLTSFLFFLVGLAILIFLKKLGKNQLAKQ